MASLAPDDVQEVVAVLIGRVGDLIVAGPFLRALKSGYPNARVKLTVSRLCIETAALLPFVDSFEVMHRLHWVGRVLMTASGLIFNPCDLAVDLNPSFSRTSTLLMTLLHRAPVRAGFKKGRWDKVFTEQAEAAGEREHMLDRYARLAALLGIPYEPRLELRLNEEHQEEASRLLCDYPKGKARRILVHAGNFKKFENRWPEEKFVELTNRLLGDPSLEVFYLAGPGEAEPVAGIVSRLKRPVPVVPPSPLGVVGAVIKRMDLCLMNITGTTHLAGALDVPTFGLYSGYTDAVWRLRGPRHFGAVAKEWESCRSISVDEAFEGLRKALWAPAVQR
ncbi:MAG: glycosyltransferase family 9 protein [Elusimicrobia bacterium]|nr:glycosyltransferase family 9 protein [Elusimicrobiota bacterium]